MVAANPGSGLDDGGLGVGAKGVGECLGDGLVDVGDGFQEGEFVVAEADFDFVFNAGSGDPDEGGLP